MCTLIDVEIQIKYLPLLGEFPATQMRKLIICNTQIDIVTDLTSCYHTMAKSFGYMNQSRKGIVLTDR